MSTIPPSTRARRIPRKASDSPMLNQDVAAMIKETFFCDQKVAKDLAHDIIVVVRERVLQEIESFARENVR